MKVLLFVLALPCIALAGYTNHRSITFDHTKVSATQTNFPVGISGTYTFLKTVANSGKVRSSSGYDIIFTSDAAGTTPLACEQESWSATTGAVTYWVKIPSLSSSVDTVIYIQYGNTGISTPQCAGTTVWDSNFKAVYHMGTSGTMLTDSTSNANNLTNFSSATFSTSGLLSGGVSFSGTNALYSLTPPTTSITAFTMSVWTFEGSTSNAFPVSNGVPPNGYGIVQFVGADCLSIGGIGSGGSCGSSIALSTWTYLVFTSGSSNNNLYRGAGLIAGPYSFTPSTPTTGFSIGAELLTSTPTFTLFNTAVEDEVRISNIVRSTDWLLTEYTNINLMSTFYTIGTEVTNGGGLSTFPIIY